MKRAKITSEKRLAKLGGSFWTRLLRMRLNAKITLLVIAAGVIPLLLSILMFNGYATSGQQKTVREGAADAFEQLYGILESNFAVAQKNASLLFAAGRTRTLLQETVPNMEPLELNHFRAEVHTIIGFIENRAIWDMRVRLFLNPANRFMIEDGMYYSLEEAHGEPWFEPLTVAPQKSMWYSSGTVMADAAEPSVLYNASAESGAPEFLMESAAGPITEPITEPIPESIPGQILLSDSKETFCYLVRVCDPANFGKTVAVVQMVFDGGALRRDMRQSLPARKGAGIYLFDSDGRVIASVSEWNGAPALTGGLTGIPAMLFSATQWSEQIIDGMRCHVLTRAFSKNSWQLAMVVPIVTPMTSLISDRQWIAVVAGTLAGGLAVIMITILFQRGIIGRINSVCAGMQNLRDGRLRSLPSSRIQDEVGELIESYNYLAKELKTLQRQTKTSSERLRRSELQTLHAQINSHFLYNTLEMVNYYAYREEPAQVGRIVDLLAKFYKRCLNHGAAFAPLSEEIDLVNNYMSIQNIRYAGRVPFATDVTGDYLGAIVPHFILQPIVENALYHGILAKSDASGEIRLTASLDGQVLSLTVADDGVGVSEESLREIAHGLDVSDSSRFSERHYGLRNIRERLAVIYGAAYGLTFESEQGAGTRVTLTIPFQEEGDRGEADSEK
ncbi:MAG: histidine kinase [Oscillospiraceae bacterium]|jgi:sensor histidine kinase YesM|nr:histidine kinase [Oscillospiraceae bacterium]